MKPKNRSTKPEFILTVTSLAWMLKFMLEIRSENGALQQTERTYTTSTNSADTFWAQQITAKSYHWYLPDFLCHNPLLTDTHYKHRKFFPIFFLHECNCRYICTRRAIADLPSSNKPITINIASHQNKRMYHFISLWTVPFTRSV